MNNSNLYAKSRGLLITSGNARLGLDLFCKTLNPDYFAGSSGTESQQSITESYLRKTQNELIRLTNLWLRLNGNISQLLRSNPTLSRAAYRFPVRLVPTASGRAELDFFMLPKARYKVGPTKLAHMHFIAFLLNPENDRLAGPCRQCGRYYIKRTKRQNIYCSTICGKTLTSRVANKAGQHDKRTKRVWEIQRVIDQWAKITTRLTWKDYVNQRTQISKNFITRADKRGFLTIPVQPSLHQNKKGID